MNGQRHGKGDLIVGRNRLGKIGGEWAKGRLVSIFSVDMSYEEPSSVRATPSKFRRKQKKVQDK
jgi:hypothetical protein